MKKSIYTNNLHTSKRLSLRRLLLRAGNKMYHLINNFHSWALFGFFLSALSLLFFLQWFMQSQENDQPAPPTEMTQTSVIQTSRPQETTAETEAVTTVTETKPPVILSKYADLYSANPDLVGWLTVGNTPINYPVVQATDNEIYLHLNFYGVESKYGTVFLDCGDDILNLTAPCNLVLYGHNMKDDSMFGELDKYKEESFFIENPTITFGTIYQDCTWEVFSAYVTDVDFYYNDTTFPNDSGWNSFLESCAGKSMYETNVVPASDDVILTLSTCTYEFDNARFVVQARLIRETTP